MSIKQSLQRLFKHSAIYGLGHIINRSIGFLLLPLYTNFFNKEDFGVAGVIMTWQVIFTLIYVYGLDAGFLRFYIAASDAAEKKKIFSTTFASIVATSLLVSLALWIAIPSLPRWLLRGHVPVGIDLLLLLRLLIAILLFDTLAFIPMLALRAEEKSVVYVILKASNVGINLAANFYFIFHLQKGVSGIFWANLASSLITWIMTIPLLMRYGGLSFSSPLLKKLFLFGLPALPSGLAIALMDSVDRIFLERFASLSSVGLYNSGSKLGMSMALLVAAFRFAWPPFFLSVAGQADAKAIYSRVLTYVIALCSFVFLLISLYIDPISRIAIGSYHLIGAEYWPANRIVPVIMLAYICYAAYLIFYVGVYVNDKPVYLIWATLVGVLVNLLANWLLIPPLDILGAAWARFLGYLVMAVSLYFFSQRLYPIAFEWQRIAKLAAATTIVFVLNQIPWLQPFWWRGILLLLSFPLLLAGMHFFLDEEVRKIRRPFRQNH